MDKSRHFASIDLGSNTALLLVVRQRPDGELVEVRQEQSFPRLGEDLKKTGLIKFEKLDAVIECVKNYLAIAESYGVEWVEVIATAALREAKNGSVFREKLEAAIGVPVRIISGVEEARLAFLGALSNKKDLRGRKLVVDIGGGSTEFIWGSDSQFENAISISIGSVKLSEAFHLDQAVSRKTIDRAAGEFLKYLEKNRSALPENVECLVGTAGTMTTLAATSLGLKTYDSERVDGSKISLNEIERLLEIFRRFPGKERLNLPGIVPGREDVILGGTIIAREILNWCGKESIIVSDRGLRFGAILDRLQGKR